MNILIAPNAFKDSLPAAEAAKTIAEGLAAAGLGGRLTLFPVGDGGDGTGELLIERLGGEVRAVPVHDPLGRPIVATFGLVEGGRTAVVEMAAAAGLRLLAQAERDPLRATSLGAGELVEAALDAGATRVLLCVGGSATVDGGCGLLQALGFRFLDGRGLDLAGLPASLVDLERIDATRFDRATALCAITVLCDVENPMLGETGAARIYGPQKGATPAAVETLERALARYCEVILRQTDLDVARLPRGGAAGGVAGGLAGVLVAELVEGAAYFLDVAGFDEALAGADLVITGEGRIDGQTLHGKAPMAVATRARAAGVPVVALAGQVLPDPGLEEAFDAVMAISGGYPSLAQALGRTREDLTRAATSIGQTLAVGGPGAFSRRRSSG